MATVRVLLCGDVMTGRGIDQIMKSPGNQTLFEPWVKSAVDYVELAERRNGVIPRRVDAAYVWGEALDVLHDEAVSARIVNLETAVTDRGEPWPDKGIHYRMHPANVDVLTVADIDCCVLANNHVLDWSYAGLRQSLAVLHRAGLTTAGAGVNAVEARSPQVIVNGSSSRVVLMAIGMSSSGIPTDWAAGSDRPGVAYAPSLSDAEVDTVAQRLESVVEPGDVVVASIHWGSNWVSEIPASHRRFARGLIDSAGVHLVHGHSSHHPLGIEVYRDRLILYGCGDLINDYEGIGGHEEHHPDVRVLYVAAFETTSGRLQHADLIPFEMRRFRLEKAPLREIKWLKESLSRQGLPLGTAVDDAYDGRLSVVW